MVTLLHPLLVVAVLVLLAGCGHGQRYTGLPSWFAIEPFMKPAQHRRGKAQQKRRRR